MNIETGKRFSLPLDWVTQTTAILAKRGVGKTYTASVGAEEALSAGQVVCVIDPTGAWWGLKSSASGLDAGYAVVVFGGDHADLPLEKDAGELIANALVQHRFSCVLDVSHLRKGEANRFIGEFLETLYRLNREAMLLIVDEADAYAPQRPMGDEARTLGAMEDIVRRGRKKGIGCTLITQRPSVLNKNVLTQCEVLIALRLVHPRDLDAIEEWVNVHADPEEAAKMIKSLPALPVGSAWFWSPGWGDFFSLVKVKARRTFDSSSTPKPGEKIKTPKALATIDLESLGADLAALAARMDEDDPKALRKRIKELESGAGREIDSDEVEQLRGQLEYANESLRHATSVIDVFRAHLPEALRVLDTLKRDVDIFDAEGKPAPKKAEDPFDPRVSRKFFACPAEDRRRSDVASQNVNMAKVDRLILTALAQLGRCSKPRLAATTGYAVNGGGFKNGLSSCRTKGWISGSDPLDITTEGLDALGPYDPLPTGRALIEYWAGKMPKCERAIILHLAEIFPKAATKPELGHATGYLSDGGGFKNALSRLRTLELINRGAHISLSPHLVK
jgi:hypothetical protein